MCTQDHSIKILTLPETKNIEIVSASYKSHTFPKHMHDEYSIVIITRGVHEVNYKNKVEYLDSSTILTLNPGQIHGGREVLENGWGHIGWFPKEDFINKLLSDMDLNNKKLTFRNFMEKSPVMANYLRTINQRLINSNDPLECEELLTQGVSQIIICFGKLIPPEKMQLSGSGKIKHTIEYLQAHYNEKITLNELANIAKMSKYHFLRSFSAQVGLPPHAYQNQLRINKSKNMIQKGKSLIEIAYECGYSDQAHFSRMFKNNYGVSPIHYRKD